MPSQMGWNSLLLKITWQMESLSICSLAGLSQTLLQFSTQGVSTQRVWYILQSILISPFHELLPSPCDVCAVDHMVRNPRPSTFAYCMQAIKNWRWKSQRTKLEQIPCPPILFLTSNSPTHTHSSDGERPGSVHLPTLNEVAHLV